MTGAPWLRLWPRSLIGRTVLVLLAGMLVSNVVGLAVFSGERRDALTSARARQIAEQVTTAASALNEASLGERRRLLRVLRKPGLRMSWSGAPLVSGEELGNGRAAVIKNAFREELGEDGMRRLRLAYAEPGARPLRGQGGAWRSGIGPGDKGSGNAGGVDTIHDRASDAPRGAPGAGMTSPLQEGPAFRVLVGSLGLADGSWLNFSTPVLEFPPFWSTPAFLVVLVSTITVIIGSVWAVRRATQPLAMFADAAERLGRDVDAPPLPVRGPLEVQQAAIAFNRMQERLQHTLRQRTQMLAAISHDLRTPLTRLRLRAEEIEDDEQQRKTVADLEDMRALIEAALAVARDEAAGEAAAALDLAVLLQTVCEEAADVGARADYEGPAHAPVQGRPGVLKRAFANLVDNAVRYGGSAVVRLAAGQGEWQVCIDDNGPGLPGDQLERVFEPFVRLEASRSRDTGGVGLGLSLVRTAVTAHGGSVVLANRAGGGLRASVRLPATAGV